MRQGPEARCFLQSTWHIISLLLLLLYHTAVVLVKCCFCCGAAAECYAVLCLWRRKQRTLSPKHPCRNTPRQLSIKTPLSKHATATLHQRPSRVFQCSSSDEASIGTSGARPRHYLRVPLPLVSVIYHGCYRYEGTAVSMIERTLQVCTVVGKVTTDNTFRYRVTRVFSGLWTCISSHQRLLVLYSYIPGTWYVCTTASSFSLYHAVRIYKDLFLY